ncbi:MAG: helix-hairpin-helix domain-containing protein [Candidatus Pacearchaeota archaeon]|nr:helix-hairpin-helix domain-containing protein [Candidatus Pacearchaeota archaeon]
MIIVDKREKNSLVIAELANRKVEFKINHLEVGDYLIGDILIERKTMTDFINSTFNKRLIKQLQNLKQYPKKLLLIEGPNDEIYKNTKINPNSVRGMVLSVIFDFDVPIIFTKDLSETVDFLILLDRRTNKKKMEKSLVLKKKDMSLQELQQFVLESFPGIGPVTAKNLLREFKTIKKIINAKEEELSKVLNKNKIKIIKRIVETKYEG